MKINKIISNKIKCKYCGDILVSEYTHDFKMCSCKKVGVDGGKSYLKRTFTNSPEDFEELSETIEEEIPNNKI